MSHSAPLPSSRLPRTLSTLETWGFGVVTHIACPLMVPTVHAALGTKALFVWVPAVIVGIVLNYQLRRLGVRFIDLAGGTSSYTLRLWQDRPLVARYIALAFFSAWIAAVPVYVIVLTDLIKANLELLNVPCPELLLKIGLTLLPIVLAFSGVRAISLLHLYFIIPALGLLLLFCSQGLSWLALSPDSPGLFPERLEVPSFREWAQWFFLVVWVTYSGESAAAFTADSRNPRGTLQFLPISAWLLVPVFIGGAWVVMRLAAPDSGDDAFLTLLTASQGFWGESAALVVTFWLVATCLLNNTTIVALCPRMLYQLALDQQLSPVFAVVSRRGVSGPALLLMLVLSLLGLGWGNVGRLVVFGNVTWFVAMAALHLGLWRRRDQPEVLYPRLSLALFALEGVVFVVAAWAWGWQDFALGLLPPLGIMGVDAVIRRLPLAICRPQWWQEQYRARLPVALNDSIMVQIVMLIVLLSGAVLTGWWFGTRLHNGTTQSSENLVAILLMTVVFVGVAIACWTSLPQVVTLAEAREATEHLLEVAQDGIMVVDEAGMIQRANPATQAFFGATLDQLVNSSLRHWLPQLAEDPSHWPRRSEQSLPQSLHPRTFEISISDRPHQDFREYVVILHDVTARKQAQQVLQQSEAEMRQQAQQLASQLIQSEKMSSLGQLVAGIAHEINNPVNFIYGNLSHAADYTHELLDLLRLYQQHYPQPVVAIQRQADAIDVGFLAADLPKLIRSMKVGAERIQKIVVSLRSFSRKDEAEMKTVDIHDGIDNTLLILQHRLKAQPHRAEIQIQKHYGQLPPVECYAGQLNQVFMNILANAIDALEERLSLEPDHAATVQIYTQRLGSNQIQIRIADNGPGIPDAIRHQLFDPFFTTKPVGRGTGLGLSLSYDIITKKHNGQLRCLSLAGAGAEFIIEIPLYQQAVSVGQSV
ncbi:MAG: amino acid permease [Synechococcales cyanobacterium M58_A2018_015]|nr:amino acid permease [Synechococcales cyanobacterium M58_A2018_015]